MIPGDGLDPAAVAAVAEVLAGARSALIITGAGISADSGLPTYRGIGGLYEIEHTEEGIPIEVALSGRMMELRPELCWKYLVRMGQACRGARPNRAHQVVAALERRLKRVWVLTQNVDGLHGDAGTRNLIEIHGNLRNLVCTGCGQRQVDPDYAALSLPPRCPRCAAVLRPDVVLFGELLPSRAVALLERELDRGFDVVLSVGTSSLFPYISYPVFAARQAGLPTVEVNPAETEVSGVVAHRLVAGAARALDALWAALQGGSGAPARAPGGEAGSEEDTHE